MSVQHPYLRHADEHIPRIDTGEKTCTLRYNFTRDLHEGQEVAIKNQEHETTHTVEIQSVSEVTISEVVSDPLDGHKEYESCKELIAELQTYYGEQDFSSSTPLTLIRFSTQ